MAIAIINIVAFSILLIGGINWGLVGIFDWNLITAIFGATRNVGTIITYVIVFLSALWLLFAVFYQRGNILFCTKKAKKVEKTGNEMSNF